MTPGGSRVGGVGPTPTADAPHHRAARRRTAEEADGVARAQLRRRSVDRMGGQPGDILCPVCSWWMPTWIGQCDGDPHPDMPHGECVNCEWSF